MFTEKFSLEQIPALILAKKLGVNRRSCEGTVADDSFTGISTGWSGILGCGYWGTGFGADSFFCGATGTVGDSTG